MVKSRNACAVLLSRSPKASKAELIALAELGSATFGIQCDAGDPMTMAEVLSWVHEQLPAVSVAAHAAGTLGFDTIDDVSEEQFWDICHAKVCPIPLKLLDVSKLAGLCSCAAMELWRVSWFFRCWERISCAAQPCP